MTMANMSWEGNIVTIAEDTINNGKKDNKLVCNVASVTKFYNCRGGIKLTINCSFDGMGYYTDKDSRAMLRKWFKDIKYFHNNYILSTLQNLQLKPLLSKEDKTSLHSDEDHN